MLKKISLSVLLVAGIMTSTWAENQSEPGVSFLAGGSFLISKPSHGMTALGGGLHFDLDIPVKSHRGLFIGLESFLLTSTFRDYVNTTANNIPDDLDRDFYSAGVVIGPKFKTMGSVYALGSVGMVLAGNYVVETHFASNAYDDRETLSESADFSVGGSGSVGFGYRHSSGITLEFSFIALGASSEDAPGIMMSLGPKLTIGLTLN